MRIFSTFIRFLFLGLFLLFLTGGNVQNWFKIFAATLFLAIIFGRFYCGYICPMNTLMIYTEKISIKLNIQKQSIPEILKWKHLSAVVFVITVVGMIFSKQILEKNFPVIIIFLVLSVLSTTFFKQELFHNQLCPFGFLQNMLGRKSVFSQKVNIEKCVGCKRCEKSCPTAAIKVFDDRKALINKSLCLQCANCKDVCPKDAISYLK